MTNVIVKKTLKLNGSVNAPSSKAYTQRMLIAASLSNGPGKVMNPLLSEDTSATLRAVTALGAKVKIAKNAWIVEGTNSLTAAKEPIDCGESGATLRFMIPIAALASGASTFILGQGLEKRPIEPLLKSLNDLRVQVTQERISDKTALIVSGGGINGGETSMPGDVSSQFVSGLMFACPMAKKPTKVTLTSPLESEDYVKMTREVLAMHQVKVDFQDNFRSISIPSRQIYKQSDCKVPGDFSSAAFLLAAAAITDSEVQVNNLDYQTLQGDKVILDILKQMGVKEKMSKGKVRVEGSTNPLMPLNLDAKNIPDLVPVLTALACFANGTSKIYGAHRLRFKESDRLSSICVELEKMGAQIDVIESSLTVKGSCNLHGAIIDPHNDHRIAMACAVAALRANGETKIQDAECVRKSYPQFFTDLSSIGAEVVGGKFDR